MFSAELLGTKIDECMSEATPASSLLHQQQQNFTVLVPFIYFWQRIMNSGVSFANESIPRTDTWTIQKKKKKEYNCHR